VHLRNQAKVQRFSTKEELLEAFERVRLECEKKGRPPRANDKARGDVGDSVANQGKSQPLKKMRCYNCNEVGHKSQDCQQPKREKSSCFGCGQTDHRIRDCPQKNKKDEVKGKTRDTTKESANVEAKQIGVVEEQIFRDLRYRFESAELSLELTLRTLLDSGSPISFVKESFIPARLVTRVGETNKYIGLNKSPLEINGIVHAAIEFEDKNVKGLPLRVVPDSSMQTSVIIGRDAWNVLGLTVSREREINGKYIVEEKSEESSREDASEILSISVNVLTIDEIDKLKMSERTAPEWHERLKKLFCNEYLLAERPLMPKVRTEIKLRLKEHSPFHFTPRRISYQERTELEKIVGELESKGVIRPSKSQYASRAILVPKKTGGTRMCVDYRSLNAITERENYPLPIIEDQIEALSGKKIFSLVDLKDGFYHIDVAKESIPYTSFVTPIGQYEFVKMPFGLKTAPATFQRHVNEVMADLIRSGDAVVYMDDFLIATRTIERHLEVLKRLFRTLVENQLELRVEKCRFLYLEIEFLGYVVTGDGVRPSETEITAVKHFPVPTDVRGVQRFLGLCAYFRKFVQNFSILAKPLYDLLRKGAEFKFGTEQLKTFETLKTKLLKSPVLALYNPIDETELHCDASSAGFGAVLMQKKEDGKFHPVFYFSKRTTEVESRYHSFELETLAIIYALRRFRIYLQGIKFKVVTDCNSLIQTLNKKDINPRIARWALELQDFDYRPEHRAGTKMSHVDALSRVYDVLVIEDNSFEANLRLCQTLDPTIRGIREKLEKSEDRYYEMRERLVYKKWGQKFLFYVPHDMEYEIMHRHHNELGHFATEKTCEIIMQSYWFPKLREKVERYIKNCFKCIAYSKPSGKLEGYVHSLPKGNVPFTVIHVDHFGPIEKGTNAKKHVLLIVDAFMKFVKLYAVKSTSSRETIKCLQEYFHGYSRPKTLISDRGTAFTSREFEDFLSEHNVKHVKVATGSPQANGQVERYNRVLASALGKISSEQSWPKALKDIEFALNNTFCKSTGAIPSVLLFGVEQRGRIIDYIKEEILDDVHMDEQNLVEIRGKAAEQIAKSQSYNEQYVNRKRKSASEYEIGDLVMIRNFDSTTGISNKIKPAYKGPYCVKKRLRNNRYVLADVEGFQLSQRPYQGVWESANMKPWRKEGPLVTDNGRGGLEVRPKL